MSDRTERERLVDEALAAIDKALDMVAALCRPRGSVGSREWLMSIPARPDYDPDLVISDALGKAEKALAAADLLAEEGEPDIDEASVDFFCLAMVNAYEVDHERERVPEGTRCAGELWLTPGGQFVLTGSPASSEGMTDEQADARHNCDRMGCTSMSHVIARYQAPVYYRPGPVQEASGG